MNLSPGHTQIIANQQGNYALANPNGNHQRFAHQLRALGQALEKFSLPAFELEIRSGNYRIIAKANPAKCAKFSFSRFVSDILRPSSCRAERTNPDSQLDLRFSPQDIEQFDLRGKSRRQDSCKMPDPYSISQLLRGTGCYLDNRSVADQVGISVAGRWIILRYLTDEGRLEHVQHDIEYIYDYWVKMYLCRSNRIKLSAPAEPTVLVTMEPPTFVWPIWPVAPVSIGVARAK